MGYPAIGFTRLCKGEDVDILYKDEFLYYRFFKQPEERPKQIKPPTIVAKSNRLIKKLLDKVNQIIF
ncbi:hypothetical protein [Nostoc sp. JL33]|uniref:hypothetical protein n=1 Tax=Nostoc sp. JL33 TaxID=2815396 RepID=UPI0025D7B3AE|nr:hypothetical protein [Nostoc sp. JL33]MBN3870817.1 hypothetical protein [Nostoc sp. JL33]